MDERGNHPSQYLEGVLQMSRHTSRRDFMKATTAAGIGFWVAGGARAEESKSANERIRFACIGVGGKGSSDSKDASRNGDIVAICDIDDNTLGKAGENYAGPRSSTTSARCWKKSGQTLTPSRSALPTTPTLPPRSWL